MKYIIQTILLMVFFFGILMINSRVNGNFSPKKTKEIVSDILDKQALDALSPDAVIDELMKGNERFITGKTLEYDHRAQISKSVTGQYPKALVLSCIDSRVPVEHVFDKGIGDLFVTRVAGNLINKDILGGMEYAAGIAGSKVILVLGHEQCGAVTAAIQGNEMGNLTQMLKKFDAAIEESAGYDGVPIASNIEYVNHVSRIHITKMMEEIRKNSPILRRLEENGAIQIKGAIYHMHTGKVELL